MKETVKNEKKTFTDIKGGLSVISLSCSPLLSKHKKSLGAALVVKDITRINFLENRLRETSEFKRIIGNSYRMDKVFELVRALADTEQIFVPMTRAINWAFSTSTDHSLCAGPCLPQAMAVRR